MLIFTFEKCETEGKGGYEVKRFLVVAALLTVVGGIAAGLSAYAFLAGRGSQAIALGVGDTYEVVLDANPTTGYQWVVDFDENYLELVDRHFKVDSDLGPPAPGRGGTETFVFRAVAKGSTQVQFTYLRPWEGEPLETKALAFDIH